MSRGTGHLGAITDLQKLVYICRACLRLLKIFITEVYPDGGRSFVRVISLLPKSYSLSLTLLSQEQVVITCAPRFKYSLLYL